jgi:predicted amidohydrolase YtcJ
LKNLYKLFVIKEIGSLEFGKRADFVVLDKNILKIDPKKIHNTTVILAFSKARKPIAGMHTPTNRICHAHS